MKEGGRCIASASFKQQSKLASSPSLSCPTFARLPTAVPPLLDSAHRGDTPVWWTLGAWIHDRGEPESGQRWMMKAQKRRAAAACELFFERRVLPSLSLLTPPSSLSLSSLSLPQTGKRCFVGNLAWRTSWQDLKDKFREVGTVVYANVMRDDSGKL